MKKIRVIGGACCGLFILAVLILLAKPDSKEPVQEEPFAWLTQRKSFEEVEKMYDWEIADPLTGELSILKPSIELYGVPGSLYTIDSEGDGVVSTIQWYCTYANDGSEILTKEAYKEQLSKWYGQAVKSLELMYGSPVKNEDYGEYDKTAYWSVEIPGGKIQTAIYIIGTNAGYSKTIVE